LHLTEASDNQMDRFRRLARPELATLLRTAGYLTRDLSEAEDLVQETMIKAMKNMATFQEGTDIKAWLMTLLPHAHRSIPSKPQAREHGITASRQPASDPAEAGATPR